MTSPNAQQKDFPEDDQRRYFDSGEIPAFVIPRLGKEPHDPLTLLLSERQLAWAYYPDKNHSTFAIGGDIGPKAKFSEATIAFHLLLRYGKVTRFRITKRMLPTLNARLTFRPQIGMIVFTTHFINVEITTHT